MRAPVYVKAAIRLAREHDDTLAALGRQLTLMTGNNRPTAASDHRGEYNFTTVDLFPPWNLTKSLVTDDSELLCHKQFVPLNDLLDHFPLFVKPKIRQSGPSQALAFYVKAMPCIRASSTVRQRDYNNVIRDNFLAERSFNCLISFENIFAQGSLKVFQTTYRSIAVRSMHNHIDIEILGNPLNILTIHAVFKVVLHRI
ncbi:hypothetical protein EMIT0P4_110151 [Pseudomonas sp. IT-P4]